VVAKDNTFKEQKKEETKTRSSFRENTIKPNCIHHMCEKSENDKKIKMLRKRKEKS